MSRFHVGERVAIYDYSDFMPQRHVGRVIEITSDGMLGVCLGNRRTCAHPKQCRRLVKRERRRVFVPRYDSGYGYAWPTREMAENAGGETPIEILEFIEVRRKGPKP